MVRADISRGVRGEGTDGSGESEVWEKMREDKRGRFCFVSIFILIESQRIVKLIYSSK